MSGAELGARLAAGDLTAAPAALNLVETARPASAGRSRRCWLRSPRPLGGEAPAHVVGVTGPPGAGKSTLLSALLREWRARGRVGGGAGRRPVLQAQRRRAARRPRADRARPRRPRRLHPLDGRRRAARRPRPRDPRRRAGAGGRVRRRGDRDRRRRPVRDRGRRGGRHRRGDRPARLRRRAAVPEGGDHGGARTCSWSRRPTSAHRPAARCATCAPRCGSLGARDRRCSPSPRCAPASAASTRWSTRSTPTATGSTSPPRAIRTRRLGALADFVAEHGERGLRALGGRRAARRWLAEQAPELDEPELLRRLERRRDG